MIQFSRPEYAELRSALSEYAKRHDGDNEVAKCALVKLDEYLTLCASEEADPRTVIVACQRCSRLVDILVPRVVRCRHCNRKRL